MGDDGTRPCSLAFPPEKSPSLAGFFTRPSLVPLCLFVF